MKPATVHELKDELKHLTQAQVIELCTRLARFKKENKELLTYLIFESHDEAAFIRNVKNDMQAEFDEIPKGNNLYFIKKSLRRILRTTKKFVRYTGSKTAEVELLLHFCQLLKDSGIPFHKSTALANLYQQQLKTINKTVAALHEDLQYDYLKQLEALD